jgi:peptide/nickel transport system substrate-binding protein
VLNRRRCFLAILVLATAGVCAPGCERKAPAPAALDKIRIGLGIPPPGIPGTGLDNVVGTMTSEAWLGTQLDGRPEARIVNDWKWDESGTVLRLSLRKDVYFHDGTLLTPELAVEAFNLTLKDKRGPSSFASVRGVKALSDGIEITLSEPNSFFVPDLSLASVLKPGWGQTNGTGPFRVSRSAKDQAVLQAFDKHYREHAAFSEVDITTYPTQRNAWAALMRDDVDVLYEVGRDVAEFVQAQSTVKLYTFPRPYYNFIAFNQRHPVLRNPEVRRALNEALNRAVLIRDGLNGKGRPADGPLLPENWAYSPPASTFEFNPAAARLRLENAGLQIRPGKNGRMPSRFSIKCIILGGDPRYERLAILVAKQFAEVGVDLQLEPTESRQIPPRMTAGEFDAVMLELNGRSLGWVYEFWHSHETGFLNTGYRSADAVLDRIRGARTDDDIRDEVRELQRILHDDPPAAFLAWQTTSRAVSTKFDVAQEPGRDVLSKIWKWRPAGAAVAAR